jgi:hemerythrin-like domain-containing protein
MAGDARGRTVQVTICRKLSEGGHVQAIRIIEDEHRSLAAVIHGMLYLVHDTRDRGASPDFKTLGAMIYYIDAFPERYHHPKEDRYLFKFLRQRCPDAASVLNTLEGEHRVGAEKIRSLEQALHRYQEGGQREFAAFLAAVESYAEFHWAHMRREEKEVLPLAKKHLTDEDWKTIDEAFAGHTDPLFNREAEDDKRKLFSRIVHIAPPPIGVGPSR